MKEKITALLKINHLPVNNVLYSADNGALSLSTKRPVREVNHLHASSSEIRKEYSCICSRPTWPRDVDKKGFIFTFAFQYLQLRFNRSVRVMASVLFTISVLLFVPLIIYVPALAFSYGKNLWQYSGTGNFGTLPKSEATGVPFFLYRLNKTLNSATNIKTCGKIFHKRLCFKVHVLCKITCPPEMVFLYVHKRAHTQDTHTYMFTNM